MEYEPVPKRRRTASPPLLQSFDSNTQHATPQHGKAPEGADDKTYQLHLERAFADPRFRATLAQIFDKYDGKSTQQDEAIDPTLCGMPTGDGNLIDPAIDTHVDSLVHTDRMPYHLDMQEHESKDDGAQTVEYQFDQSNENADPYAAATGPSGYMPGFPGAVHPGFMQTWYSNPFQGSGHCPSPWDGFSGQLPVPHAPHMTSGPWVAPENFAYSSATWPSQVMPPDQSTPPISQPVPALQPTSPAQEKSLDRPVTGEDNQKIGQEDESTDNCQLEPEISYDALGRKRRRRPMQPRFSKNGKRLGRPPKPAGTTGVSAETGTSADTGAYDGEGEDNGGLADLKNPAGEFGDEDDDTLWSELAEALQLASKATSKKRTRDAAKPSQKGENSATESDGATETDKCAGQAETMLRKIQQELIDRAVRRSTMAKEHGDDTDGGAEGRRRSGRERKPANFGEQVSWEKVSAERRTSYKIKMHLRALSVQARRERKKQEKEEAALAAKEKEAAEKVAKEKREAEEVAAVKDTPDGASEAMPSTIPDSQDTVTSLPIRTTPKKPQSTQIMRQTIKNHVNSVVHFEEDDEGLPDDQAPAAFPIKNPVFSYKKPEMLVHSFLGENYIDTVYALSDDEAPALLDSLKRVSLGEKKKPSLVPVAVDRPWDTAVASKLYRSTTAKQTTAEAAEQMRKESTPSTRIDTNALDPGMGTAETIRLDPIEPTKPDEATTRPSVPTGGDGDDSGIDIRSEQASSEQASGEQAERPPVSGVSIPAAPLPQDPNILGAADILDSLDVMSEAGDVPSSPISDYSFAKEDTRMDGMTAASVESAPASSRMPDKPLFVDEEPMYESMDIFEDATADMALMSDSVEMEDDRAVEPMVKVSDHSARKEKLVGNESPKPVSPIRKHEFTNIVFVAEKPDEFDIDADEDAEPFSSSGMAVLPPPRHPLPQQSKPKGNENRKPTSSLTSRTCTPRATSKEPSPNSTGERPRLSSSSSSSRSSSRAPAPVSKASSVRKGSSSRRSLLSLIGGGEDDIESLLKKKPTTILAPKPALASTPAYSSSPSSSRRRSSSAAHGSSSHRKSKPASSSSSSLTRMSLGSLSSLSRDKPRSSKERQEAKERRRKSAGAAAPGTNIATEKKGTCGVDGYTCGRDFCFTCL